jgi:hypothetical protein
MRTVAPTHPSSVRSDTSRTARHTPSVLGILDLADEFRLAVTSARSTSDGEIGALLSAGVVRSFRSTNGREDGLTSRAQR